MSKKDFFTLRGERVIYDVNAIKILRLHSLAKAIEHQPQRFTPLHVCNWVNDNKLIAQSIIVDVDLEIPQSRKVNIQNRERIEIVCCKSDDIYPEIFPLRIDFPETSHRNSSPYQFPLSLCLYNRPFNEIKLVWNPTAFIDRICEWFEKTATGTLHPDDQPIEPFFFDSGRQVIIPSEFDFDDTTNKGKWITGSYVVRGKNIIGSSLGTVILEKINNEQLALRLTNNQFLIIALPIRSQAAEHGIVHNLPKTIGELKTILNLSGIDLISSLREFITNATENNQIITSKHLLLLVETPLLRDGIESGKSRSAFFTHQTIGELGVAIDVLQKTDTTTYTRIAILTEPRDSSHNFGLDAFNCYNDFTANNAALLSNTSDSALPLNYTLIGCGAIGSQIFSNLIRSGLINWTIVEPDFLMPHNLVRHVLNRYDIGLNKGKALQQMMGTTWQETNVYSSDISVSELATDEIAHKRVIDSDIILDCSASQSTSRTIALDIESNARRMSAFIAPGGQDSVLMIESKNRNLRLDMIEAQYFRYLLHSELGSTHLRERVPKHRYGHGCRDRTVVMAPEILALHGGLLTQGIKKAFNNSLSSCSVWSVKHDASVSYYDIPIISAHETDHGNWKIIWDEDVANEMARQRKKHLPNETGGPLIGYYDVQRNIIYIVDVLPPPPDSESGPSFFIRGCAGLKDALVEVQTRTGFVVTLVGDWHSHPKGFPPEPSNDDLILLVNHGLVMAQDGFPGVISIISDDKIPRFYIATIIEKD